jgi:hypothetical protein
LADGVVNGTAAAEPKLEQAQFGLTKPFGDNLRDDLRCLAEAVGVNWRKFLGKG